MEMPAIVPTLELPKILIDLEIEMVKVIFSILNNNEDLDIVVETRKINSISNDCMNFTNVSVQLEQICKPVDIVQKIGKLITNRNKTTRNVGLLTIKTVQTSMVNMVRLKVRTFQVLFKQIV